MDFGIDALGARGEEFRRAEVGFHGDRGTEFAEEGDEDI